MIVFYNYIFFIFKVIGVAGNKYDLYEKEKVTNAEVEEFSNSIGAIFKYTSASNGVGIKELFMELGKQYLEKYAQTKKPVKIKMKSKTKLSQNKKKNQKCC